jgi:hypothetical protein
MSPALHDVIKRAKVMVFPIRSDRREEGCSGIEHVVPALWTQRDLPLGTRMHEQALVRRGGYRIAPLLDES